MADLTEGGYDERSPRDNPRPPPPSVRVPTINLPRSAIPGAEDDPRGETTEQWRERADRVLAGEGLGSPLAKPPEHYDPYIRGTERLAREEEESNRRYRERVDPLRKEYDQRLAQPRPAIPTTEKVGPPPDQRQYQQNALAFMSAMSVLGAFTGRLSRAPAGTAMRAFAAAADGWREGNQQAYENGVKQWEASMKRTLENNRQTLERYDLILKDRSLSQAELMERMKLAAVERYDDQMYNATQQKNLDLIFKLRDMQYEATFGEKGIKRIMDTYDVPNQLYFKEQQFISNSFEPIVRNNWVDPKTGRPYINTKTGQPYTDAEKAHVQAIMERHPPGSPTGAEGVGKTAFQLWQQQNPGRPVSEFLRMQSESHQPRSAPGMALRAFMDKFRREHGGEDPSPEDIEQFQQDYAARSAYGRTSGSMSARVEAASNEVVQLIPQAVEASRTLPRGPIVPLNKLMQQFEAGTSDLRYNDFIMANQALINAYVRAMNPQGIPRIAERLELHALGVLSTATSQEAYEVQVRRLWKEVQASKIATARTRKGVDEGDINAPVPGLDTPTGGGGGKADPLGLGVR